LIKIKGTLAANAAAENDYEENKKLFDDSLEYNKNIDNSIVNKKTVATQVDYVSLIMARNFEDWNKTTIDATDDQNQLLNSKTNDSNDEPSALLRKTYTNSLIQSRLNFLINILSC
jgi:hypothetical protein